MTDERLAEIVARADDPDLDIDAITHAAIHELLDELRLIPVKERMPESDTEVLVWSAKVRGGDWLIAWWCPVGKRWATREDAERGFIAPTVYEVTHWLPLPPEVKND